MELSITWGLKNSWPEGTTAVWGARAIQAEREYLPYMDFLYDRQSTDGEKEPVGKLLSLLNGGALAQAQEVYSDLVAIGEIDRAEANQVTLYEDDEVKFVANTRGSYGYVYVAAWLKGGE